MKMIFKGVNLPVRKTTGSCGYDLYCPKDITLNDYEWTTLDMGLIMEEGDIPDGHFAMILPRSSMGFTIGLKMANTVGIIDSDYRETIKASLKLDKLSVAHLHQNERILQMIIVPFATIPNETVPTMERKGGLGSTGV